MVDQIACLYIVDTNRSYYFVEYVQEQEQFAPAASNKSIQEKQSAPAWSNEDQAAATATAAAADEGRLDLLPDLDLDELLNTGDDPDLNLFLNLLMDEDT